MKSSLALAWLVLLGGPVFGDEPAPVVPASAPAPAAVPPPAAASTTPAPAPAPAEAESVPPTAPPPAPTEIPVVRIPVPPTAGEAAPTSESISPSGPGEALGDARIGWSRDAVNLRQPAAAGSVTTLRTNQAFEMRGVIPRVVRPERKGVGGFVAGFANLFNPFAPTREGVAAGNQHWYDGQVNAAPLPRGQRDERFHEPTTALFLMDLDGDPGAPPKEKAKK